MDQGLPVHGVEAILDHKVDRRTNDPDTGRKGLLKFLVKWDDFEHPEWESHFNITGCQELLTEYYRRHPDTPRRKGLLFIGAHEENMAAAWLMIHEDKDKDKDKDEDRKPT